MNFIMVNFTLNSGKLKCDCHWSYIFGLQALHVSITERDMEKEHQKQIARGCAMSAERQIKSKRKT